jgi:hypothetical protein
MRRTTLFLLLALVLFSFGYTSKTNDDTISKIYLIDNTLIRMNTGRDIRFYDIHNPASPTEIGMIANDGNHDVAVRDHYMYADYQSDLVVYDISNMNAPVAIDTIKNIFNQSWDFEQWNQIPRGDVVESDGGLNGCGGCISNDQVVTAPAADAGSNATGQGGSLARFVVVGDYLYCVDRNTLKVFEIIDPARPRYKNTMGIGWDIETIFHDGTHLFIGGQSGMYIYDITDQGTPTYISEFTHTRSCDPVVVEGNRAYVTLRGGTPCGGFSNQLDILDITDISNPKLLRSVPLSGPYGLTVRDSIVIVCDGAAGLKILDARDPNNVPQLGSLTEITPHDVILRDNLLIVTADDGYYLYNVSDIAHPTRYSRLP